MSIKKTTESVISSLKDRYPLTRSIGSFGLLGVGLFLGASSVNNINFLNKQIISILSQSVFALGCVLIAIYILSLLSETMIWWLPELTPILQFLIRLLTKVVISLRFVYIFLVKFLIRGAVEDIISKRTSGQKIDFVFQKQPEDDHYFPNKIEVTTSKAIEITSKPSETTDYWRLGLKFSKDGLFPDGRAMVGFPLFHLTKQSDEKSLRATYYDEAGKSNQSPVIMENYDRQEIKMVITKVRGQVTIKVSSGERLLKEQPIGSFDFCQLFAWGDRKEYKIDSEITSG